MSNTLASGLFVGEPNPSGPEKVDIEAWSERGSDPESDVFVEESFLVERYDQVLTLLRLP